jgi:hypothetical protein
MLRVQEYLLAHSLADLESAFGISARRSIEFPNLVMLSYNQIASPMNELIVQQCRGIILDESDRWAVRSYPFDKFFNYGELNAAAIDWSTAKVCEKLDGSLMTLYWHKQWIVAASGTPDASGPAHESGMTFSELFWKTWNQCGLRRPEPSDSHYCFMFELMTPHNRIVVQHSAPRLALIGARDLTTMREVRPETVAEKFGVGVAKCFPLQTLAECVAAAAAINGIEAEGFVVCDDEFRRVKIKAPHYVSLAQMKDSLSPRAILDVIRRGESAEVLSYFPEVTPVYNRVLAKFDSICDELNAAYAEHQHITSQKDFAQAVRSTRCPAVLFAIRAGKAPNARAYFAAATQPAVERVVDLSDL